MKGSKTPYGEKTDGELVLNTLSGDGGAFGELFGRYYGKVLKVCLWVCSDGFDAEDAAQEAFIDAFIRLGSLSSPEKFGAWLCSIARRKALRLCSLRRTDEDVDSLFDLASGAQGPFDALIQSEEKRRVAGAMGKLSQKRRTVAEKYYFGGMKAKDIARSLGLSVNAVKSRLYDAREFLRKELEDMNENRVFSDPETRIRNQIEKIARYYCLHGGYDAAFKGEIDRAKELIGELGDEKAKKKYTASVLSHELSFVEETDAARASGIREEMISAAEGANARVIADCLIQDVVKIRDASKALGSIEKTAMPKIEEFSGTDEGDAARGELLFWRGWFRMRLGNRDGAKEDFSEAAGLIPEDADLRAAALAALSNLKDISSEAYGDMFSVRSTAESLILDGDRVVLLSEPGFSSVKLRLPGVSDRFSLFIYYAARCRRILFDPSMKPGDRMSDEKNKSTLECVSSDEKVVVPAGEFSGCLRFRTSAENCAVDLWYAKGTGIVKAEVKGSISERYELSEYEIKGGKGYFPCAAGNRWAYVNPELPDWLAQRVERKIEYFSGDKAVFSAPSFLALKKDFETSCETDSTLYIALADELCGDWKIDEAIGMLKKALRANSNEASARIALYGIEVLTRFSEYQKKGYRFCPSSINAFSVSTSDGKVKWEFLNSFGPYRLGARGRYEDRIFGIKPFNYLDIHTGKLWDEKWVPGYSETKEIGGGLVRHFDVADGGSVSVPAGTISGCRKITVRVDKPEGEDDRWFFKDNYAHMDCGLKEYWFAPGVGIVKMLSFWGKECEAECLLERCSVPGADEGEYFPIHIGSRWEYCEPHLEAEGYRARAIYEVPSGMNGKYLMTTSQEFVCFKTEDEYNEFTKKSHRY
ncbi:MAG: sigma-70 family RNA polymerase sigma factor [Clostridia bacterium]|nr:sigma-70 family RNA polymerase sigma factor [Clostridia bacterium]